jgi:hypothetical protein
MTCGIEAVGGRVTGCDGSTTIAIGPPPASGRGRNESEQRGGEGECQATDGLSCSDVGWSRAKVRMNPAFVNIVMGVRWGMI